MITQDNNTLPVNDNVLYTLVDNNMGPEALQGYTGTHTDTYDVSTLIGEIGYVASIIRTLETENDYSIVGDIGDGAGISFGAYQFTMASGSLKAFLINYIALNPNDVATADGFLQDFSGNAYQGDIATIQTYLLSIAATPEGIEAQDITFKALYYDDAIAHMPTGITSFVVKFEIIDAFHNGGGLEIAAALHFDNLVEVERLRIEHWMTDSNWANFEDAWRYRLGRIRTILGIPDANTTVNDITVISDELLTKQLVSRLIELNPRNDIDPKVSGAALYGISHIVELI